MLTYKNNVTSADWTSLLKSVIVIYHLELQKGFFCQNDSCKFAIWKNNKWWAAKKKQPTKAVVSALLKDGRVRVTGLYSEKTGKTYDAAVVLEDDGQYANFKLEFDQRKGGS